MQDSWVRQTITMRQPVKCCVTQYWYRFITLLLKMDINIIIEYHYINTLVPNLVVSAYLAVYKC